MINEIDVRDWDYVEVKMIAENPDGSADCDIKLGPIAHRYLLNFAFITVLKNALAEGRLHTPPPKEQAE